MLCRQDIHLFLAEVWTTLTVSVNVLSIYDLHSFQGPYHRDSSKLIFSPFEIGLSTYRLTQRDPSVRNIYHCDGMY
jgi:hypothetical protein